MDKMNEIESIILQYLQGFLSEEDMKKLRMWLNESEANKELFFRMKQVYDLRPEGLYPHPEEVNESWERLLARIEQLDTKPVNQPVVNHTRRLWLEVLKYAASGLIFICTTLGIQQLMQKKLPSEVHYTELNMEAGPRMSHLTLPDGTKVVLNASTKFHFPDKFNADIREVFMDGEAFFDVVHQEERPFVVHTDRQTIRVLGTTFNVMDYSEDDYAITTLLNGSVEIQPAGADSKQQTAYRLKPNQQAFLNKKTSELTTEDIRIDLTRTWVNKMYHFREEPLYRITQRLEKLYGIKIYITDEALKYEKYTGVFRLESPIEEVMKIINYQKQFAYEIKASGITINANTKKQNNNP
jgi:ferric-dicitrate binding protein FerR (iron transport regulator)